MHRVEQNRREYLRRQVGPGDGQPEHRRENEQHERESQPAAGEQTVESSIEIELGALQPPQRAKTRNPLSHLVVAHGQGIVKGRAELPPQRLRAVQDPASSVGCDRVAAGRLRVGQPTAFGDTTQVARQNRSLHSRVSIEQTQRDPARVGDIRVCGSDGFHQSRHSCLYLSG